MKFRYRKEDASAIPRFQRWAVWVCQGLAFHRNFTVLLAVLGAIALSLLAAGLFQQELINPGGIPQLARFWLASLHPDRSPELLSVTWTASLQTLAYAVCGSGLSLILGAIAGILISEVWWVAQSGRSPVIFWGLRSLLAIPRAIHELLWGLLFLNLWGTDPLTAILAIALPFGAITAKVFADILDETPRQPLNALLHSGVPPLVAFAYGVVPLAWLNLLSYGFYRFECAIRAATVLGLIGAGGLGYQVLLSLQSLRYEQVWTFIYALVILNGVVDLVSARSRRWLGCASRLDLNLHNRRLGDRPVPAASDRPGNAIGMGIGGLALVIWAVWWVNPDIARLWSPKTLGLLASVGRSLVPPDVSILPQLLPLAVETVAMSIVAIAIAGSGSTLFSFPAAHTLILPGGLLNPTATGWGARLGGWCVFLGTRLLLLLSRAVPAPVWALVVLFVWFPGILPGAIALGIHNLGILGRLKAEVVENLDERPLLALKAQGAPASLVFSYGVVPLTLTRFLAYDLYRWEVCMRETVVVGIVGAGGLGYLMSEQLSSFDYAGLGVTLLCFLGLTVGMDWISAIARRALR